MSVSRIIIIGLLLRQECSSHFLEWLGWSSARTLTSSGTPLLEIPFEELGPEDKFLIEASKITGLKLSQLDVCQHKIVMKIKTSCGALSDEDIAKLSVNLLNCQADVEGRKIFPCTEDMSLKSCTSEMDGETWNAYHIMSNRARAVCYAARQEEFRALAEMTINRLVSTARTHIEQMAVMQEKQDKLEKATQFALDRISRSQHDVLNSYSRLRRLESGLMIKLEEDKSGLEAIGDIVNQETESIGNILKDFKKQLGDLGEDLNIQQKDKSAGHEKIMIGLKDSLKIIENIIEKLGKLGSSMDNHDTQYLSQTAIMFNDLKAISKSLNEISISASALQQLTEQKMSLVSTLVGETGEKFDLAVIIAIHLLCLLVAMVICSFLEFARRLKAIVVIAGVLNAYSSVNNMFYSFQLFNLYLSLAGVVIVDVTIVEVIRMTNLKKLKAEKSLQSPEKMRFNMQNVNGFKKPLSKVDEWLTEKFSDRESLGLRNGIIPTVTPVSRANVVPPQDDQLSLISGRSKRSTRAQTRNASASPPSSVAGSSASGRKTICSSLRTNGQRCRLPAKAGLETCRFHEDNR